MTRTMQKWAWIGGLVGAGVLVGGVAYAVTKSNAQAPKMLAAGVLLQPGHRYQLSVTDPQQVPSMQGMQGQLVLGMQQFFDRQYGAGQFVVRTVTIQGATLTAVFDYVGKTALTVSTTDFDLPTTATIADLGAAP